ncbi:Gfo/Idh/MocA family protein [Actinophytocola sp.]|uniref:Gfo/Idh/MocA family protein n=1 Tax=Actinophytocola sp. TaxID=1872138 RepID=UPI00389A4EA6
MLRIGVVGLGVISRFYLAALAGSPQARLAAVCDVREQALAPWRGVLPCHLDHRAMLTAERLDGVVVTTPNDTHAAVCRDVLAAGVPVCVEKPLATSLADGRELARLARAAGLVLLTAFHRRHNTTVRRLARGLRTGPPVESVTVRYWERIEDHVGADGWYLDPARCGGGCVADNGPNAVDLARMFLGDLRLRELSVSRDETGVDRRAAAVLSAATGAVAHLDLDWSYPGECKQVEVALADGSRRCADMLAGHREFKGSLWHEYVGVLDDFVTAVRTGQDCVDSGLAALEFVDAVYRAEAPPAAAR